MDKHAKALAYALQTLSNEKYLKHISAIYLYGSCARGDYKHDSDVDLFLQLEPDTPKSLIREMKCDVIPDDFHLPEIELKTSSSDSFSNIRQFEENIRKEGKLLWKRD